RRISPAASPSKAQGGARKAYEHKRQAFGLAGAGRLSGARRAASPGFLLAVASTIAWAIQCLMTAVAPAHRCGAVPDFARVPFYPSTVAATCVRRPTGSGPIASLNI